MCVQSLRDWPGDSHVTIAGEWLAAGKYLLQLALDPARSEFQVGQHGSLPFDVFWKLQLLPNADAKVCPVVPDDSRQKYSQVGLPESNKKPIAVSLRSFALSCSVQRARLWQPMGHTVAL